jgi:hypothetical protein
MNARPVWTCAFAAALLLAAAAPANAQNKPITEELIELMIRAFSTEQQEAEKVAPQLAEVDENIRKFNECKELYEAGASASGSRLGGIAARAAIRAKCGASNTEGFEKDRQKIMEGPEKAALSILGLKAGDYRNLKSRVQGFFNGGGGFGDAEAALLNARRADFGSALRMDFSAQAADGGSGSSRSSRARPGFRSQWTTDYAWQYIGQMFEVMYVSGATVFEKPYQPGQWTTWEIVARETRYNDDSRPDAELESKRVIERAFIGTTPEGGEWWRTTSIDFYDDNGTQKADTVVLESLFKSENEYVRQLVRVRAKLPGQEANELMVPQHFAMLSLLSAFPMKPTPESVQGATVGTERVGSFDARQVRFAAGSGGAIEWWLADDAPGGWVRFRHTEPKEEDVKTPGTYTIQMVTSGTGAKSQLGVM